MKKDPKAARDLEATQLVTLDDLNELKQLQRDHAAQTEPTMTEPARRRVMKFGAALGLAIAAGCCLALLLLTSLSREAKSPVVQTVPHGGH